MWPALLVSLLILDAWLWRRVVLGHSYVADALSAAVGLLVSFAWVASNSAPEVAIVITFSASHGLALSDLVAGPTVVLSLWLLCRPGFHLMSRASRAPRS